MSSEMCGLHREEGTGVASSTSSEEVKIRARKSTCNPEVGLEKLEKPPACAPNLAQQPGLR